MQFNNRLRALRQDKDLTQDALAKALNIDRKTLSNYETAYRTPSIYLVVKMANYFEVSVDYLLGLTDILTPYPKKHK
ncbi:helix-turn-helix domain-containing protein [Clostridium estertheticum]|uniref:helix-turn-helix transcriptional regulator n=1 Tax=Clostridium estertheticum TaxID=238834 RepID=UPI001C0D9FD0|nr:helix-turn-helix transcriptional regulator [Clostridium estertheticum]MBU3179075.1 helix-turn-helix domain-containing protein [Clostridium estertheticum]